MIRHTFSYLNEVEEEMQLALATSLTSFEDEVHVAQYASGLFENDMHLAQVLSRTLKEKEDTETAIAISKEEFNSAIEEQDQAVEAMIESYQTFVIEAQGTDQLAYVGDYMLDDLQNQPRANFEEQWWRRLGNNSSAERPQLALIYKHYRTVPTVVTETEMWPRWAVETQRQELSSPHTLEEVTEWCHHTHSESDRCLVCLTNVATRVAIPCGHNLCCCACVSDVVNKPNYYSVTTYDGEIETTDRRLPVQCFTCRAIIGQIIVVL